MVPSCLFEPLEPRLLLSTFPNESTLTNPPFTNLWYLHNTGQTLTNSITGPTTGTPGADIHAPQAWDLSTGSHNVVVAILDTGIDLTHPDLAANIWTKPANLNDGYTGDTHGYNFISNSTNVSDAVGHGTAVAGVIGAVGNNGQGIVGVNWNVSILPVVVADATGANASAVAAGINYIVNLKNLGVNIVAINASFLSFSTPTPQEIAAIANAGNAGILFVNAAGNTGLNIDPIELLQGWSNLTNVITVASTDNQDNISSFSNFGPNSVALGAPGTDILTTGPANTYLTLSGTSFSTPMVTGAVALLAAEDPAATMAQLKAAILAGVDADPSLQGKTITGGRLNVANSLQDLLGNRPPFGNLDVATSTTLVGWAFDPNAGNQPVTVNILLDNSLLATVSANQPRPDLAPLGSTNHGFSYTLPALSAGSHTIQIVARDVPTGSSVQIAAATLASVAPGGNVDVLTTSLLAGWAFAPANPTAALTVQVNIDGQSLTPITANQSRPDLTPFLGSPNHGFSLTMPQLSPGYHRVDVYVLDPSTNTPFLLTSRTLNTFHAPGGNLDTLNATTVAGWAFDPDLAANPVNIRVDIDGVPRPLFTADLPRPDLTNLLGSPNHGFSLTLPALSAGQHTIAVYAVDLANASLVSLGSSTVTIAAAPPLPLGNIDILASTQIVGWAFASSAGATPLSVQIAIDSVLSSPFLASDNRPDLAPLGSTNHGFSFTPPVLTPGPHLVDLYALNPLTNTPTLLRSGLLNDPIPGGHVDILTPPFAAATPATIAGWAYFPATPTTPISIRIDIDGSFGPLVLANQSRPDLATLLGSPNHGFFINTLFLSPGQHTLTISAIDPYTLTPTLLSQSILTFP